MFMPVIDTYARELSGVNATPVGVRPADTRFVEYGSEVVSIVTTSLLPVAAAYTYCPFGLTATWYTEAPALTAVVLNVAARAGAGTTTAPSAAARATAATARQAWNDTTELNRFADSSRVILR
ncbi:hypothetical protein GCM10010532_012760 [Dactylosporangium siamense]|uniref:Uncharacterized protein n=1 Tax=Dactylosporangium siamense TaxID=685454 RepID=A0A919Q0I1_9ACTN|nr:hypothetical protein Dsi01nite_106970 [Dactylosporangium siamense]